MSFTIRKDDIIDYPATDLYGFSLCMYEWIDNLHFTLSPAECLHEPSEYIEIASKLFKEAGWAGDGQIELMWIPPFMFNGIRSDEFTKGVVIWHVKQTSDGFSWILSPIHIPIDEDLVDISTLEISDADIEAQEERRRAEKRTYSLKEIRRELVKRQKDKEVSISLKDVDLEIVRQQKEKEISIALESACADMLVPKKPWWKFW